MLARFSLTWLLWQTRLTHVYFFRHFGCPVYRVKAEQVQREAQDKEGRIPNDRPDKDVEVPPIALLYAPFGRFLVHICNRPEEQPGVDLREFQFAIDRFASVTYKHLQDKDECPTTAAVLGVEGA